MPRRLSFAPVLPAPGGRWIELRGRDHPQLGPLAAAALDGGGALALGRGAYPKPYAHVDPNEDGAFVYRGRSGSLLCVVDGHSGALASELALDLALERAEGLLAARGRGFTDAVQRLAADLAAELRGRGRSRTCLLVAALADRRCQWASVGDCALQRSSRPAAETRDNDLWLGAELPDVADPARWSGAFELLPGERVAAMSDGITSFVRDPARIQEILTGAADDASAAVDLAQAAMHAGAGDNVAVAALAPYPA